jgi:hypothetical protein
VLKDRSSDCDVVTPPKSVPGFWRISRREAYGHCRLAAVLMWTAALVLYFTPGARTLLDGLKGGDFIQFYTQGAIVRDGETWRLSDADGLYARQVALVPASAPERYLPVYPPHTGIFFRPFAAMPYGWAVSLWACVLILAYFGIVWSASRTLRRQLQDDRLVMVAAAAFPAFWSLVLHGQSTLFPLCAFTGAWVALEARWPFAAGLSLSLLSVKPQFGFLLPVIALTGREGVVIAAGALVGVGVQAVVTGGLLGMPALWAYGDVIQRLGTYGDLLEPRPWQTHSLHTLTKLFPSPAGQGLWIALVALLSVLLWLMWRSAAAPRLKVGALVTIVVLANPHLFAYDATLLVLPLIWICEHYVVHDPANAHRAGTLTYGLCLFVLAPTAAVIRLQISVLFMMWLLAELVYACQPTALAERRWA